MAEDLDEADDESESVYFETASPIEIPIGESKGNQMYVRASQFGAISVDGTQDIDPMTAMQEGISPTDDRVVAQDDDDGTMTVEVDEASIFVSNSDHEIGGGVHRIEDGGLNDVLDDFARQYC